MKEYPKGPLQIQQRSTTAPKQADVVGAKAQDGSAKLMSWKGKAEPRAPKNSPSVKLVAHLGGFLRS